MSRLKKTKYLGKKKETSSSPDKFELDSVPNPHPKNNLNDLLSTINLFGT